MYLCMVFQLISTMTFADIFLQVRDGGEKGVGGGEGEWRWGAGTGSLDGEG